MDADGTLIYPFDGNDTCNCENNKIFTAHAREDLPDALARIRELGFQLANVAEVLRDIIDGAMRSQLTVGEDQGMYVRSEIDYRHLARARSALRGVPGKRRVVPTRRCPK